MKVDVLRMLWPACHGGCLVSNAQQVRRFAALCWPVFLLVLAWWIDASTARAGEPLEFVRDVLPVLQSRCVKCHGPQEQRGQLRLELEEKGQIKVAGFRDLIGSNRRYALALLSFFDNEGLTQRSDDVRTLKE